MAPKMIANEGQTERRLKTGTPQTKSHAYQKSDAQGHLIDVIKQSDSQYVRCAYSFDKEGRSTGQINYDAARSVLDKSTAEYRENSQGN
jgi:hypothetical protein